MHSLSLMTTNGIWILGPSLVTESNWNFVQIYRPFHSPCFSPVWSSSIISVYKYPYFVKGTDCEANYYVIFWNLLLPLFCSKKKGANHVVEFFAFPVILQNYDTCRSSSSLYWFSPTWWHLQKLEQFIFGFSTMTHAEVKSSSYLISLT